ncbi:hypothetical protein [Flavitalea sp.]|nr:hypothetical protein [Flavitalea sp.]
MKLLSVNNIRRMFINLLTENGRSAELTNAYRAGNLSEDGRSYFQDTNKASLNELQKRAHTGNFLAGAQAGLNPGFFK